LYTIYNIFFFVIIINNFEEIATTLEKLLEKHFKNSLHPAEDKSEGVHEKVAERESFEQERFVVYERKFHI
jgi:hypothetical protein